MAKDKKNKTQQVSKEPIVSSVPVIETETKVPVIEATEKVEPVIETPVPVMKATEKVEPVVELIKEVVEEPKKPQIKIIEIKKIDPIEIKKVVPSTVVSKPVVPQSNINSAISDARAARTAAKRAALNGQ